MKLSLLAFGLLAFITLFALAAVHALMSGKAWVPFTTGVDAARQVRRIGRPVIFWMLTLTHAALALGATAVLVRLLS